jgi:uncharacterized protein with NRDE domain
MLVLGWHGSWNFLEGEPASSAHYVIRIYRRVARWGGYNVVAGDRLKKIRHLHRHTRGCAR